MSRERGKNYPFEALLIMMFHAFYLTILNSLRSLKRMGYRNKIQNGIPSLVGANPVNLLQWG